MSEYEQGDLRPEYDDAELAALLKSGICGNYTERCQQRTNNDALRHLLTSETAAV